MSREYFRRNPWFLVALAVGLILRTFHYLRKPAVWQDEGALIRNVLELRSDEMFGPLLRTQAAPPLFLVVERAIVLILGDGEYALRLFPFLASCLGLILFADLVRRVLAPWSAVLAVVMIASSDRLLWHGCEAKPYAVDFLVAVLAAYWFVRTEGWNFTRRCLSTALPAALALWISYPSCYVIGAFLIGLLPASRTASWLGRSSYLLLAVVVGCSFLALANGPVAAQHNTDIASYWHSHFPDWNRPWSVPGWAVISTLEVSRYNFLPIGQVVLPFAILGGWCMIRRGEGSRVAVAILPLGLAFVASLLHRYPYGSSRLEMFAAPGLAWLAAEGAARLLPRVRNRSRYVALALLLLLLVPIPLAAYRTIVPWPRPASDDASAYVLTHRSPEDRICVNHWEFEYYFRHEAGWRFWLGSFEAGDIPSTRGGTIWVVHTSSPTVEEFPFPIPTGWAVVEIIRFESTRVFRIRRVEIGQVPR